MEEIMQDLGYQRYLESSIMDKMFVKNIMFDNQVFMSTDFIRNLAGELAEVITDEAEVEYEHSTSTIFVKADTTPDKVYMAMYITIGGFIANGYYTDPIDLHPVSFLNTLATSKISFANANKDICSAMQDFLSYYREPVRLTGFFKVIQLSPNEFNIILN